MTRILAYITGILIFATFAWAAPQIQPLDMQGFKIFRLGAGTVASDAVRMDQAPTSVTTSGTGYISQTAANTWATRSITESSDGISITNGDGVSGNTVLAPAQDLAALEAMASTGLVARTGSETYAQRSITESSDGIAITNGDGVSGNVVLAPAQNLAALEAIASTGHIVQTGTDTVTVRTQTGTTDEIEITNGSGVSGNPTYAFDGDVRAGWLPIASLGTMTYNSATVINTSVDFRSYIGIGDRLKLTNSTTKYFYVSAITSTTMTVLGGSDYSLANAAITGYYSHSVNPVDFPTRHNWTPTLTGFSADPTNTIYQFYMVDVNLCMDFVQVTNGTSNATGFTATAPIAAKTVTNGNWGTLFWTAVNNGAFVTTPGRVYMTSGSTTITLNLNLTTGAWTNANGKRAVFHLCYPIA